MKTNLLLSLLFIITAGYASAQMRIGLSINVKADTTQIKKYKVEKDADDGLQTLILSMNYGSEKIVNPEKARALTSANIMSVDLVYTGYPNDDEIINELMKRRILELYFLAPDVFKQSMTKWKFIEQTSCKNAEEAKVMFHGFVIKYMKPEPYKPEDISSVKKHLDKLEKEPGDSTVTCVFKRNPHWKQELIVADFTGSMSPYFEQVFLWFYIKKFTKPVNFVFFNDGDTKRDDEKRVGSTGGVYSTTTNNIDTLIQHGIYTAMRGGGGDTPENDVEAILTGLKKYDKVKEVILIADNWADMRDYSLIKKIDKPVHVILCGSQFGINTQYLDLARASGGSVHTIEEDITDLMKLREGEKITINKAEYVIKGGRFIPLVKS